MPISSPPRETWPKRWAYSTTFRAPADEASPTTQVPPGFQVCTVPGDGNCLYHALCVGSGAPGAADLRQRVVLYATTHPEMEWHGASLRSHLDLVTADTQSTSYAEHIGREGEYGGCLRRTPLDSYWKERFTSIRQLESSTLRAVLD